MAMAETLLMYAFEKTMYTDWKGLDWTGLVLVVCQMWPDCILLLVAPK